MTIVTELIKLLNSLKKLCGSLVSKRTCLQLEYKTLRIHKNINIDLNMRLIL